MGYPLPPTVVVLALEQACEEEAGERMLPTGSPMGTVLCKLFSMSLCAISLLLFSPLLTVTALLIWLNLTKCTPSMLKYYVPCHDLTFHA